eukprot:scaffold108427_cov57-Phaeocystis_antarctica.AAC.1
MAMLTTTHQLDELDALLWIYLLLLTSSTNLTPPSLSSNLVRSDSTSWLGLGLGLGLLGAQRQHVLTSYYTSAVDNMRACPSASSLMTRMHLLTY